MKVAITGASGLVGRKVAELLEERGFSVSELSLFASERSENTSVRFRGAPVTVRRLTEAAVGECGAELVFSCTESELSARFTPLFVARGGIVIDNSSHYRLDPTVPLIVPEVNADSLTRHRGIIANPNCSTIQAAVALKPIEELFGIKRLVISTYQAVSGAGKRGIICLREEARRAFESEKINGSLNENEGTAVQSDECFRIADTFDAKTVTTRGDAYCAASNAFLWCIHENVIPVIGKTNSCGYSEEENKIRYEIGKIFGRHIAVTATCVRVGVLNCHCESVNVECVKPIDPDLLRERYRHFNGVAFIDSCTDGISAITPLDVDGSDLVYVSRLRKDPSHPNAVDMWVVADNLRKGAALNAVQIAEATVAAGLLQKSGKE